MQATREELPLKKKLDFIQGRQAQARSLQQRVAELLHLIAGGHAQHESSDQPSMNSQLITHFFRA